MHDPFRLARQLFKLVLGDPEPPDLSSPRDPSAYRPVRSRRGPPGRVGGVAIAEPDEEELLVMAVARPRARH